jgi:uncharacterized protein YkwD
LSANVNRCLALLALLLAFAGASCTHEAAPPATAAAGPDQALSPDDFDGNLLSSFIIAETNRVRLANGAAALKGSDALDRAADEQAARMALAGEAEHDNPIPGEHNAAERVATQGVEGGHVGENVIMMPLPRDPDGKLLPRTYAECAAQLVEAWMNSPGHRANMLEQRFTNIGCAARLAHAAIAENMRVYACQVFYVTPRDQGVTPGTWR